MSHIINKNLVLRVSVAEPGPDKWTILRGLARKQLSPEAQLKLEWIIFYNTVGKCNVTTTATHFGISRKTLHKWLSRFDERHLKSLEEHSRKPNNVRDWMVTQTEEARIRKLRKENMEFGKRKLKALYIKEYGEEISTWKIERVIRRYKLFPVKPKYETSFGLALKRKKRLEPRLRIHKIKEQLKQINQFGLLWHIDAIIIYWNGQRRIIFTAMEDVTKIAFARVYTSNTSSQAEDFLERLIYLVDGKISIIHQDNGGEFQNRFKEACIRLHITQVYSRPHTPKDNSALERFNRTVQEEWLSFSEVGLDDIQQANYSLTEWLIKYNFKRPHQALDYQTPLEYAQQNFFQLLPMYPASSIYSFGADFTLLY